MASTVLTPLSVNALRTNNISINCSTQTFISLDSNSTLPVRNEDLAAVEIVVQSIIFVLAVLGNTVVVMSLLIQRHEWTRMHLLMLHLCFADLFVAFGSVLPQLIWDVTFVFKGGNILCKIVKYMQIVAIYASSYVLVMTAIDRYFAIVYPFMSHQWSMNTVHRMVLIAWTLSLLFSLPQVFIFSYELSSYGVYDCWGTFDPKWTLTLYITCFTVLVYIIPLLILLVCYVSICITVWENSSVGVTSELRNRRKGISHAKIKTIKLTLAVVLCYLICWSPFFIAQMWAAYDEQAPFYDAGSDFMLVQAFLFSIYYFGPAEWTDTLSSQMGAAYTIILLLASLNSCTNPWIYVIYSDSVLQGVKRIFYCLE